MLVLREGEYTNGGKNLVLGKPTKIYGQGRGRTTLVGFSLEIKGNKSGGIVEIGELTIKGAKEYGLETYEGMNVIMRGCTIEECGCDGVCAHTADITCDDLQVIGCGMSGVFTDTYATITLSGQGTSIQGNGTRGDSYSYGLRACKASSYIHLVHPLTKEQISTDNRGGGNWGGYVRNIKRCEEKTLTTNARVNALSAPGYAFAIGTISGDNEDGTFNVKFDADTSQWAIQYQNDTRENVPREEIQDDESGGYRQCVQSQKPWLRVQNPKLKKKKKKRKKRRKHVRSDDDY